MAKLEVESKELSLLDGNLSAFSSQQLSEFFRKTPANKIKVRPGKGGRDFKYVAVGFVIKKLNKVFGGYWNFEVLTDDATALDMALKTKCIALKTRLTVFNPKDGIKIFKDQYGRKEVAFKKGTSEPLDFGNDMKAAASDGLKKCASEFGLFSDIYSDDDFLEISVIDNVPKTAEEVSQDILDRELSSKKKLMEKFKDQK